MLRFLEGLNSDRQTQSSDAQKRSDDESAAKHSILICATNRKQDLDAVLLPFFPPFLGIAQPIRRAAPFRSPRHRLAKADL